MTIKLGAFLTSLINPFTAKGRIGLGLLFIILPIWGLLGGGFTIGEAAFGVAIGILLVFI